MRLAIAVLLVVVAIEAFAQSVPSGSVGSSSAVGIGGAGGTSSSVSNGGMGGTASSIGQGGMGGLGGAGGLGGIGYGGDASATGGTGIGHGGEGGDANAAGGAGGNGYGGAGGIGQGGTASNAGNTQSSAVHFDQIRQSPSVFMGPAMPTAVCQATAGGFLSFLAGLGFAMSYTLDQCEVREEARSLVGMGRPDQAFILMCLNAKHSSQLPACKQARNTIAP